MKKNILVILILSLVLLFSVIVIFGYYQVNMINKIPITANIMSNDSSESVTCWQNENGEYYLFLPGYAKLSEISIHKETSVEILLDGVPLLDGISGASLQLDHPYTMTYTLFGKEKTGTLTIMRSGGVPTMYIDTLSGSMDYIHNKKGNEESAIMRLYDASGILCNEADVEAMNGRGNSTWDQYDKKPYSLHFASEIDLLGMGAAREWILLANATDKSNVRNKLVYDFASAFGLDYSPESDWVDLYLNGNYMGLYLLCERNEVHENRVDISGEDISLISLEMESRLKAANLAHVLTKANQALRVHYPLQIDAGTFASLSSSWQSLENAILSEDGIDSVTGKSWQELIDLESWAKKYLIEEVFGNIDGGYLSQYFYMDETGKAFAGPVWDYDYAIGNDVLWQLTSSNIQLVNKLNVNTNIYRAWFYGLWQKEEFRNSVLSIYQSEFVPLLEVVLAEDIKEYMSYLPQAAEMNAVRWFGEQNWSENVDEVICYMNERIDFFDMLWFGEMKFCFVCLHSLDNENNAYQMILCGDTLSQLPILKDRANAKFIGWYYEDTDEPFDPSAPIYEDTYLYAKWENVPSSTIKNMIKVAPVCMIAVMFLGLFFIDIRRNILIRRVK